MNRQQFLNYIEQPYSLSEASLKELSEIVNEYPYFQASRMLWVKNLHEIDSIKFNSELKQAAAYINDRTRLYHLLNEKGEESGPDEVQDEEVKVEIVKKVEETKVIDDPVEVLNSEPKAAEVEELEKSQPPIEAETTSNYFKVSDSFDFGDGNVLDFSNSKKESKSEISEVEEEKEVVLPSADFLDYEFYSSTSGYIVEQEVVEDVTKDESRSFSDWLKVMRHAPVQSDDSSVPVKKKSMQLIENFLSENPVIVPKKDDQNKKSEVSIQKSYEESDDLMTETLANIHIKQKHYSKAINIFEKLRLKYPEKNAYFANRISEMENLINNL